MKTEGDNGKPTNYAKIEGNHGKSKENDEKHISKHMKAK